MNREYYELKDCHLLLAMTGNSNIYHLDFGYKPKTLPDHKVIYTFTLTKICAVLGELLPRYQLAFTYAKCRDTQIEIPW